MTKMILTLAALATLGTAALTSTDASAAGRQAFHPVKRAVQAAPVARAGARNSFHLTIRLGNRAWRRAPAFHAPAHFGYHPGWHRYWHRPVAVVHHGYPVYRAPVRFAAPAYQPGRPAMQAAVNGMNVTMVAVPSGQYSMTGPGQWVEQTADGKTFQFTEVNRNAASVTLSDGSRGVELSLDLGQREVFFSDGKGPMRPLYPIVNASAK